MRSVHGNTYTASEIFANIRELTKALDEKLLDRKSINADIKHLKEQIKYWQELDQSQTRIL